MAGGKSFLASQSRNGTGGVGRSVERGLDPGDPTWEAKSLGQGPQMLKEDPSVLGVAAEVSSYI